MFEERLTARSVEETQKIAQSLIADLVRHRVSNKNRAVVVALEGNLGAGKTTFVQGMARALGIRESVLSPTFVLMKAYRIKKKNRFRHLVHIDCYRLSSPREILHLGFKEIFGDKDSLIVIEWADKIRKLLPPNTVQIRFRHGSKISERVLRIS